MPRKVLNQPRSDLVAIIGFIAHDSDDRHVGRSLQTWDCVRQRSSARRASCLNNRNRAGLLFTDTARETSAYRPARGSSGLLLLSHRIFVTGDRHRRGPRRRVPGKLAAKICLTFEKSKLTAAL